MRWRLKAPKPALWSELRSKAGERENAAVSKLEQTLTASRITTLAHHHLWNCKCAV